MNIQRDLEAALNEFRVLTAETEPEQVPEPIFEAPE